MHDVITRLDDLKQTQVYKEIEDNITQFNTLNADKNMVEKYGLEKNIASITEEKDKLDFAVKNPDKVSKGFQIEIAISKIKELEEELTAKNAALKKIKTRMADTITLIAECQQKIHNLQNEVIYVEIVNLKLQIEQYNVSFFSGIDKFMTDKLFNEIKIPTTLQNEQNNNILRQILFKLFFSVIVYSLITNSSKSVSKEYIYTGIISTDINKKSYDEYMTITSDARDGEILEEYIMRFTTHDLQIIPTDMQLVPDKKEENYYLEFPGVYYASDEETIKIKLYQLHFN